MSTKSFLVSVIASLARVFFNCWIDFNPQPPSIDKGLNKRADAVLFVFFLIPMAEVPTLALFCTDPHQTALRKWEGGCLSCPVVPGTGILALGYLSLVVCAQNGLRSDEFGDRTKALGSLL